jgi:meso-butanediol dehydrogenase / (S,S)-butanediol dehydrogenase / diacetyl reductase
MVKTGRLAGRVAVITGGASGIGRASVALFAREGAHVFAVDRRADMLKQLLQEQEREPELEGSIIPVEADLSREDECRRVVEHVVSACGKLDVLFNNVGINIPKVLHETTPEEYADQLAVNLGSVFWCCKYALPHMIGQRSGVILNTSSKTGIVAQKQSAVYCATKGAVISLTQAIALDYAEYGIRANALCPGIIDTPMLAYTISQADDPEAFRKWNEQAQPLGRLGTPEECAQAALFLASDDSSFITGVALPVDGGFTAQ